MYTPKWTNFFFYIFVFFFFLSKICKGKGPIFNDRGKHVLDTPEKSLIKTCLRVSNAIKYYEEFLKNYPYDDKCLIYSEIGNSTLEKHKLQNYNCYAKIQKPLCKLSYTDTGEEEGELGYANGVTGMTRMTGMMGDSSKNQSDTNLSTHEEEDNSRELRENKKTRRHINESICSHTKIFFIHLIRRCLEGGYNDPLVHCASLDIEKKIIMNGPLFCESSYERRSIKDSSSKAISIYGNHYNKYIIKTFDFKKEQYDNCLNMVNIYNTCSIIEKNSFKNTNKDLCLTKRSKYFCNMIIEKENDLNYIYTCSDIFLPYLLSSKDYKKTNTYLCYHIGNYVTILKEKKNYYLKEKKKSEENVKNLKLTQKLYKIVENIFHILNKETKENILIVNNLFNNLKKLKNKNILSDEYILKLSKINEDIIKLEKLINSIDYPILNMTTINTNISLVNKNKKWIEDIVNMERDISYTSNEINEYININKKKKINGKKYGKLNFYELNKLKNKQEYLSKLIQNYAKKSSNSVFQYNKSLTKHFIMDIKNFNNLVEVYTSQISLLIKMGISPMTGKDVAQFTYVDGGRA
ncbi:conserved Plasmodium protein, unknown function [Plasmodium ovale]|uniref:Uncharacterized protein n=2 Tax=Plasmodium ovale TaxID=36330 RepID=A0A1A8X0R0_PLAOA|nr:conserved Plasmodium protein, unknown function [Plasmodium ovale curtisi]SCP04689.1 conserved Plasmodium protein, unknown function [Plasmodium ovale]